MPMALDSMEAQSMSMVYSSAMGGVLHLQVYFVFLSQKPYWSKIENVVFSGYSVRADYNKMLL